MNAACRGRVDGPAASPSTTTTTESAGPADHATLAGGGSLSSPGTVIVTGPVLATPHWAADSGGTKIMRAPQPAAAAANDTPAVSGNTQVTSVPAAAPPLRTLDGASHAAASATTPFPTELDASGHASNRSPNAAEGGTVPAESDRSAGASVGGPLRDGVAAGTSTEPGARVTVVGHYLDTPTEGQAAIVPNGESLEIGRKPGTPFEHDPYVERYHAALIPMDAGVLVEDFGTTNGVFARITSPMRVEDGDQFRVGEELLAIRTLCLPNEAGVRAVGCPDPGYWARIDMLVRPDLVAASFPVDEAEASVGREDGNIQFPDDVYVSAEHCRVRADGQDILLEDLGSEHGTFVRVRPAQVLPYGSTLLVGRTLLRLDRA